MKPTFGQFLQDHSWEWPTLAEWSNFTSNFLFLPKFLHKYICEITIENGRPWQSGGEAQGSNLAALLDLSLVLARGLGARGGGGAGGGTMGQSGVISQNLAQA